MYDLRAGRCVGRPELSDVEDRITHEKMKRLCNGVGLLPVQEVPACPVRLACLELALELEQGSGAQDRHGIMGGLSKMERLELAQSIGCGECGQPIKKVSRKSAFCETCRATKSGRRELAPEGAAA